MWRGSSQSTSRHGASVANAQIHGPTQTEPSPQGLAEKQRANAIVVTVHVVSFLSCNRRAFLPGAFPSPSRRSLRDQPQAPHKSVGSSGLASRTDVAARGFGGARDSERSDARCTGCGRELPACHSWRLSRASQWLDLHAASPRSFSIRSSLRRRGGGPPSLYASL